MLPQGYKYRIVQKASRLSINQSYKTWTWWNPAFHWVSLYTLAQSVLGFLGCGYISKICTLNFVRKKGGDEVKNNELLAFGRHHFKHQVCHQVFLKCAQKFENIMSVVIKSQLFLKRALISYLWSLQHIVLRPFYVEYSRSLSSLTHTLYLCENWYPNRGSDLPKAPKLVAGRTGRRTQEYSPQAIPLKHGTSYINQLYSPTDYI